MQQGEELQNDKIYDNLVLKDDQALLVMANTALTIDGKERQACERWMEYGPCNYVPPIGVEIIE